MRIQLGTCRRDVVIEERTVSPRRTGDQHVIDRARQFVEEASEPLEVGRVERRDARAEVDACAMHALWISGRDDDRGSLS